MRREPLDYAWWLASRAAGGLALLLVTVSVLIGLLMASGLLRRPGLKKRLLGLHEHTALVALVAIAVHGITLLGDRTIAPGPVGILVPFMTPYRALYTGIGIVAGYAIAALALTFYVRRRIGARRWRQLHRFTVFAYVLSLAHAIGAGSDAEIPAVRYGVLASVLPAAVLFVIRSERAAARQASAPARARAAAASAANAAE
ncbi:MAG TPA: ferric reductase-like transmembrane domain-containing protein [Solirubrobacteraceae bacterium]|nr:ferric reductase-like transmembrane domain-containing protein [Solirubrobacteraceae bacterium]